jgi:kynurenine formamidase
MPKYIDLTADMYDGAPTMPMDPKLSVSWHCTLDTLGYNLSRVTMSTHQGTHVDAPLHMLPDAETIDQIALERWIVRAVKADLTYIKPRGQIGVKDLLPYEKKIDEGYSILLDTGWGKVFPQKEYFSDFPMITMELAEWFGSKKVGLVGMDMPCPNPVDWKGVHQAMLGKGVLIVEGIANLSALGGEPFTFMALPLKLKGRDGSPVRAVAMLD